MNREVVKEIVVEAINNICGAGLDPNDLDENKFLSDIGMDSLDIMTMSIDLELSLIEVKNQEEYQWTSIKGVIDTYCHLLNIA